MKMKQLLISAFAAAVLLLFGSITEVNADPLTYKVKGDSVTIVDCDENASGELVIPSSYEGKPVASIGREAFEGCSGLTSVTIGNSVTSIGEWAFYGCSSLTSVTIPDSVTSIGKAAFSRCIGLTSVTIPDSVTSIGGAAFEGCSGLTSVTIGNSVTSIGEWAFYGCSSLTSVTIPDSVTSIGKAAFNSCSSLTSIIFEDNAPVLGDNVFWGVSENAKIFVYSGASGYGERFGGLPVVVTNTSPPTILTITEPLSVLLTQRLELNVEATGTAPLRYQWHKDGKPIHGAVSSALVIDSAKLSDAGVYSVMIINNYGATVSDAVPVVIETNPPTILTITEPLSVLLTQRLELNVEATGTAPLRYQWHKDGKPIHGAVSSALVIDSAKLSDAGVYYVLVINENGATVSDEVKVSVVPPKITLEYRINEKGKFELKAIGPSGSRVRFQHSGDFKIWTDYLSLPLNEGSTTLSLPVPTNKGGQLFYRLKLVE